MTSIYEEQLWLAESVPFIEAPVLGYDLRFKYIQGFKRWLTTQSNIRHEDS